MSFVHLHVHSHYSLLDGLVKISDLVRKAKEMNMRALALTDHGVMYGIIEFYKECKKEGIKPIIGMEGYVAPRGLHLKKARLDEKNSHVTLLAATPEGYKNLMYISTVAHVDGFYYKPRLDLELLKEHHKGILCLSGCLNGQIPRAIREGNLPRARSLIEQYLDAVGQGNFYLEIMPPDVSGKDHITHESVNQELIALAKEFRIPLVATADVHYVKPEDQKTQDILLCIGTGTTLSDPKRFSLEGNNCSFRSEQEMQSALGEELTQAIDESGRIADRIEVELDLKTWHFPPFEKVPVGQTAEEYFRERTYQGARERLGTLTPEMIERLEYELDTIRYKKYHTYFLVVANFMTWARDQGIITTARGSVAGSLVAYALNITMVNPLFFQLPFERFLTKERPSPPDIDCDIQDSRRSEVIEYIKSQYGRERVAQICTFGTMMARAAVRDIARVLGYEYAVGDRIAKTVPFGSQGFPMSIARAKQESPQLMHLYVNDPIAKEILDYAEKVEGNPRHVSIHAAGLVVTPTVLTDYTPLQLDPKGSEVITQYDMYALDPNAAGETVGLLKLDLLGLRNLNILDLARKIIKKQKGVEVDLYHLPLDDKKTFVLLAHGHTTGVFQMSGDGMTRCLKDLRPSSIFDIAAMVALYRPGPIENIPKYIQCKNNPSLISYLDPRLEPILKTSYGVLTYQDDVLLIAISLAGYTWQDADKLRKAIGKKIPTEMEAQREKFIHGCMNNGMTEVKAKELFTLIEPFAAYGFNKAHAASYGLVAYQTAYLKAHYPAQFMTALLVAEQGNMDTIAQAVEECKKMGIAVLPPSVNESLENFTYVSDQEIRFGLSAIKNLGEDICRLIINERKKGGVFTSLTDFLVRLTSSALNKKSLESLIKAGALEVFGERGLLLSNIDVMLEFCRKQRTHGASQDSLFHMEAPTIRLQSAPPASVDETLLWEKEFLGMFLSGHPFTKVQDVLASKGLHRLKEIQRNGPFVVGAHLDLVQKVMTKNKELMVFATLSDTSGEVEAIVFPKVFARSPSSWEQGHNVLVKGRMKGENEDRKLVVEAVCLFSPHTLSDDLKNLAAFEINNTMHPQQAVIQLSSPTPDRQKELKDIFEEHPGTTPVVLVVNSANGIRKMLTQYRISLSPHVIERIESVVGKESVSVNGNV